MKALLIIDVQRDYCPGGTVPVGDANQIIPVLNVMMNRFPMIIASKDWHQKYSKHFNKWPVHCVQGSKGARFHPGLDIMNIQQIFLKGTDDQYDGYSVFEADNADLEEYLKSKGVTELFIGGLNLEYSIKETVKDAVQKGFKTYLIRDAVGHGYRNNKDLDDIWSEMISLGAEISDSLMIKID